MKDQLDYTNLKPYQITKSGNYIIMNKLNNIQDFQEYLFSNKIIFARHRVYSSSFMMNWNIRLITQWLNKGWFWTVEKTIVCNVCNNPTYIENTYPIFSDDKIIKGLVQCNECFKSNL